MSTDLIPLALYAHFPWCVRKCPYCDFNSHRAATKLPEQQYIDALLQDLQHDANDCLTRPIVAIFLGGGTPSLFSPEAIARFLSGVRQQMTCVENMEVSMEVNPGTLERGRFAAYRAAGVNRISLGVQSFDDQQLQQLGRIHSSAEVYAAVAELRAAGFENFNIDLMYGLPAQTVAAAGADIAAAIALAPTHISHYQLTLEPGTAFFHRPPALPDMDVLWDMQCACQQQLAAHGYQQYEISAYARAGYTCMHNLNYWQFGDYLGLGAGAHGKLTQTLPQQVVRTERRKQPQDYLRAPTVADRVSVRTITAAELIFEFMLNALRLRTGFTRQLFEARTQLAWEKVAPLLQQACAQNFIEQYELDHWRPTELGQRFLNDAQALFLP